MSERKAASNCYCEQREQQYVIGVTGCICSIVAAEIDKKEM